MKKTTILCLIFILGMCIFVNAQKQSKIPAHLSGKTEKMMNPLNGEELPIILSSSNPYVTSSPVKDLGLQIGFTYYDLQGNSDIGNRMMVFPDGKITAVWTMAPDNNPSYTNRGTGINYSTDNGVNWKPAPTVRIETTTTKTGWPSIGELTNGALVVTSHGFNPTQGAFSKSTNNGTTWATTQMGGQTLGLTWCRMVTSGNTIHVIGHTSTVVPYAGFQVGALVYINSTDGGTTWSDPIIPTGLDTSNYAATVGFNDSYSFASKGDTLAIVYGDNFRTPCLVKSTNNGTTWSYTEILHLPIKKYDTEGNVLFDLNNDSQADNLYCTDGVHDVVLDESGKAHVFFGRMKSSDDGSGSGYGFFPYTDGIYYWNEDMGTINYQYRWTLINGINTYEAIPDTVNFPIITEVMDINSNGVIDLPDNGANVPFGPYLCSLSSHPNAVIRPDSSIVLFYSSLVEGTDGFVGPEHRAYRNIWEIHKFAGASNFSWSTPVRIAEDDFTEEVWPCVSPVMTNAGSNYYAHLWYQGDGYPGNALVPSTGNVHPIAENTIYYVKYNATNVGIDEQQVSKSEPLVYPNPALNYINISYNLTKSTTVSISIYNLVGQQIMTTSQKEAIGDVNVTLNIETLTQGIYFIKSEIGNKTYTNKVIVK